MVEKSLATKSQNQLKKYTLLQVVDFVSLVCCSVGGTCAPNSTAIGVGFVLNSCGCCLYKIIKDLSITNTIMGVWYTVMGIKLVWYNYCYSLMFYTVLQLQTFFPCTASQAWSLSTYLPVMIGDKVHHDDHFWACYLLLLEISKYCTARATSVPSATYVAVLIEQHHRAFRRCYPHVNMTPKLHYMVHFPRLLLLYVMTEL